MLPNTPIIDALTFEEFIKLLWDRGYVRGNKNLSELTTKTAFSEVLGLDPRMLNRLLDTSSSARFSSEQIALIKKTLLGTGSTCVDEKSTFDLFAERYTQNLSKTDTLGGFSGPIVLRFWSHLLAQHDQIPENKRFFLNARNLTDAAKQLQRAIPMTIQAAQRSVQAAREYVYDQKYGTQAELWEASERQLSDAIQKSRGELLFQEEFERVIDSAKIEKTTASLAVMGIGDGSEGTGIYDQFQEVYGFDIAKSQVDRLNHSKPFGRCIFEHAPAENFYTSEHPQFDLYISLKTFSSSYLDVDQAAEEVSRCLKPNGIAIISIPNGYFNEDKRTRRYGLAKTNYRYADALKGRSYSPVSSTAPYDLLKHFVNCFEKHQMLFEQPMGGATELFLRFRKPSLSN
ncbi:MAG: methyltransferase domain-containing protein [Pseudomonadota bacterium]